MEILSHRGYWKQAAEKNTIVAFERSFSLGFGTETDLRDHAQEIVIAHDMPDGSEMTFTQLLELADSYATADKKLPLALNIKADGLVAKVQEQVAKFPNLECFVFDMSIPDMRGYLSSSVDVYTRLSDMETTAVCLDQVSGIWLDSFDEKIWYTKNDLASLLKEKTVCVVSAELHGYDPKSQWALLQTLAHHSNLQLCTDIPELAVEFFKGK